ncbi:MAG TPA: MFS transporter [Limnochordia bacterium]|nr:MFS transporter [Limnochordia bacterium]
MASAADRAPSRGRTLGIYMLGVFLGALDMSVVAPAFPLIAKHFGVALTWDAWTITTYTIAYTAATVLAGAAGDRFGRRKLFAWGVAAFGLGSALCAVAGPFWLFLAARVVQGAGAGAIFPNAQAEGIQLFPPERRGRALGMFGAVFGLASMIGPNVGGILAQLYGWQSIFWINVPIAVVVLAAVRMLPRSQVLARRMPDWRGGVAFAGLISAALFALTVSGGLRIWLAGAAAFFALAFASAQRRAALPFIKADALRAGGYWLFAGAAIVGLDMASLVFVPLIAQNDLGFSVLSSGVSVTPMAFLGALMTGLGGILIDRIGPIPVVGCGMLAWSAGGALLAIGPITTFRFFTALGLFGLGTAFTMGPPLNKLALGLFADEQAGEALSLMSVFRSIGIAAGPVILAIAEHAGGYGALFGSLAVLSLAAVFLFVRAGGSYAGIRAAQGETN